MAIDGSKADLQQVAAGVVQANHGCASDNRIRTPTGEQRPSGRCVIEEHEGRIRIAACVQQLRATRPANARGLQSTAIACG